MNELQQRSQRLIKSIKKEFYRSLYSQIEWDNRLIELKGARGVGKTTLMLQKAASLSELNNVVLYVSADWPYFFSNSILQLAEEFFSMGGQYLFIDEIHKYPPKHKSSDWALEVKNVYDTLPDLNLVYSGSSILQLYKSQGDLSRRKSSYLLKGLSFREYLQFTKAGEFDFYKLDDILTRHNDISNEIADRLKILPLFKNFLRKGHYPFFMENEEEYYKKIEEIINVIIDVDIPSVSDISFESSFKLKKLLAVLSSSVPFTPNLSKTASDLYITDQRTMLKYITLLENAELISTLSSHATGIRVLNKPQKIFLNNPNLIYTLAKESSKTGSIRETFFMSQVSHLHELSYPEKGDFKIDNKYTIEIGGKNKTKAQIANLNDAYLALDDIETGFGNRIPLWMFGFLY